MLVRLLPIAFLGLALILAGPAKAWSQNENDADAPKVAADDDEARIEAGTDEEDGDGGGRKPVGAYARLLTFSVAEADLDQGGGFAMTSGGLSAGWRYVTVFYHHNYYNWSNVAGLPFGDGRNDPWDDLHIVGISGRYRGRITDKWGYFLNGGLFSGFEKQMGDVTVSAGGGFSVSPFQDVRVSVGASFFYHPVRTLVLPVLGLSWKRSAGKHGDAAQGLSLSLGFPETSVGYRFNEKVGLRLGLVYTKGMYRLADDSPVQPRGYVETQDVMGGFFVDLTPIRPLKLSLGLGWDSFRELTVYNKDAHQRGDFDLDAAPSMYFRLNFRF